MPGAGFRLNDVGVFHKVGGHTPLRGLALDLGMRNLRANLEWAEAMIAAIQNHQTPKE